MSWQKIMMASYKKDWNAKRVWKTVPAMESFRLVTVKWKGSRLFSWTMRCERQDLVPELEAILGLPWAHCPWPHSHAKENPWPSMGFCPFLWVPAVSPPGESERPCSTLSKRTLKVKLHWHFTIIDKCSNLQGSGGVLRWAHVSSWLGGWHLPGHVLDALLCLCPCGTVAAVLAHADQCVGQVHPRAESPH